MGALRDRRYYAFPEVGVFPEANKVLYSPRRRRSMIEPRHEPQGAMRQKDGSVVWRVWAPRSKTVGLILHRGDGREEIAMVAEDFGYYTCRLLGIEEGTRYAYKLGDAGEYPDPASRFQPEGVHRPSAVFFPENYRWSDSRWRGVTREDLVIYELHVGTFTPEGTLTAITDRLAELASLGVTALELMPLAQFPGNRNWGYDGVHPFSVQNSYGGPRALQRLIDAAHGAGMAILLDVVYNHFGPEGNYFGVFGPYFTDHYRTGWGRAINFDGADSDAVRQLVIDNARMWVHDFHADGLRLDAVHAIYDSSARHILADIQAAVQEVADRHDRLVHVIAESDLNDVRLIEPVESGGHGLDGVWSDDFHHSVHALLTGEQDGYYRDFGGGTQLVKAYNDVFVYDGAYSHFRRRRHGNRVGELDRTQFVVAVQTHDQVGNRAVGDRFGTRLAPEAQRLACGLLLLSPCVPLLFMGEEYGETSPFPFFCSFGDAELIEAVRRGRRAEFADLAFTWKSEVPDPQSPETFASAKLQWRWPEGSRQGQLRALYGDLLAARRRWPALRDRRRTAARLQALATTDAGDDARVLILNRGDDPGLLAFANLTAKEALLRPADLGERTLILSTEQPRYGGRRTDGRPVETLLPFELMILGPREWRQ
jgi:maltooligosyltrehalose trehalohydrolase